MADDPNTTPATGEPVQGQVDTPDQSSDSTDQGQQQQNEPQVGEGALKALEAERKRARELERELKQLRQWKEEREKADMSELERAQREAEDARRRAEELEQRYRRAAIRSEVIRMAAQYNLADPDDAFLLLNQDAIEFDEDSGQPTNIEDLIKDLAKQKPYLVKATQPPEGPPETPKGADTTKLSEKEREERRRAVAARYARRF